MQDLIEELIRVIGHLALRVFTLGRYRGGVPSDRLPEGAIGLAVLAAVFYFAYALMS